MIPYFEIPSLHLFTLGSTPFDIHAFGVLVVLAVWVGMRMQERRAAQLKLDGDAVAALATYVVVAGFLISHVFDVVAYEPEKLLSEPSILFTNFSISSFGGLLGATVGLYLWHRRYPGRDVLTYADATVFGFVFAWVFGRLGCFSAHDHPGNHTDFFLAVSNFRPLFPGDTREPRHDLGLYEALWAAGMAGSFAWVFKKRTMVPGFYVAAACIAYAPARFTFDFLRFKAEEIPTSAGQAALADARYFGLTPGQYASMVMLAYGVWLALRLRGRSLPPATAPAA